MKHALYPNFMDQIKRSYNARQKPWKSSRKEKSWKQKRKAAPVASEEPVSGDAFLAVRIRSLLDKYGNNPEVIEQIRLKTQMYEVNRTIAREMKSAESEEQLTEEFIDYLSSI